jgi:hypothetical protein
LPSSARTSSDEAYDDLLTRFVNYSKSRLSRDTFDELVRRGWQPNLPAKRNYIRWTFQGRRRLVSLYQNSADLITVSRDDIAHAITIPGAQQRPGKGEVHFRYQGEPTLTAIVASSMEQFANGGT